MIIEVIMALVLMASSDVSAVEVYKLQGMDEFGDYGQFTLTATKEYQFW